MKMTWLVLALGALNLLLLGSNGVLLSALNSLRGTQETLEVKALRGERAKLAAERARIQGKVAELSSIVERLRSAVPAGQARQDGPDGETTGSDAASSDPFSGVRESSGKPDPLRIELLPPGEMDRLNRERLNMPFDLSGNVLLQWDMDLVLSDPLWNSGGRTLDERERAELARHLEDYRYFARTASEERYKYWVEPEVPRLRAAGAYVEYPEREPPPPIPGVRVSHSEPSERAGYRRLFYFLPEEYPELYHHRQVSKERGLETFLKVYSLINGGV